MMPMRMMTMMTMTMAMMMTMTMMMTMMMMMMMLMMVMIFFGSDIAPMSRRQGCFKEKRRGRRDFAKGLLLESNLEITARS